MLSWLQFQLAIRTRSISTQFELELCWSGQPRSLDSCLMVQSHSAWLPVLFTWGCGWGSVSSDFAAQLPTCADMLQRDC